MSEMNEHINNYLSGKLSGEELVQFENRLKTDAAFKSEVEMHGLANQAIISGAQLNIKNQLQEIHIQHKKTKLIKSISIIALLAIAVTILIVIFKPISEENKISDHSNNESVNPLTENNELDDVATDSLRNLELNPEENQESEDTKKLIVETLTENKVKNPDSILKLYGPIENIILNLEKIVPDEDTDSLKMALEKVADSTTLLTDEKTDPCLQVNQLSPKFVITEPIFGGEDGAIQLLEKSIGDIHFSEYSIDGGRSFVSAYENLKVGKGKYELLVKDENACLTKSKSIQLNYKESNYVIQPSMSKNWEIEIPELNDAPLKLEIRNARTGALVFTELFDYSERFTWNGTGQSGTPLSMGNYVYIFSTKEAGLITKGQITIL